MSITFEEFVRNCDEIVELSNRFPGCEWRRRKFEIATTVQCIEHSTTNVLDNGDPCVFQYHVVYSDSYGVPVLYFNAWLRDGKLLRLNDVWSNISKMDESCAGLDPWSVLTQQEHPYLHQPWFMVHPCKTEEMMRTLTKGGPIRNYVLSWLSVVAQLVGLQLPLELAQVSADSSR